MGCPSREIDTRDSSLSRCGAGPCSTTARSKPATATHVPRGPGDGSVPPANVGGASGPVFITWMDSRAYSNAAGHAGPPSESGHPSAGVALVLAARSRNGHPVFPIASRDCRFATTQAIYGGGVSRGVGWCLPHPLRQGAGSVASQSRSGAALERRREGHHAPHREEGRAPQHQLG
jgi:hypothetical protein